MKDFPDYQKLKYYYGDKTTSDVYVLGKTMLAGAIIITEDNRLYFEELNGDVCNMNSEHLREDNYTFPYNWANSSQISYIEEIQPYDFQETWTQTGSMYSKDLWRTVMRDMRTIKLDMIDGKVKYNKKEKKV